LAGQLQKQKDPGGGAKASDSEMQSTVKILIGRLDALEKASHEKKGQNAAPDLSPHIEELVKRLEGLEKNMAEKKSAPTTSASTPKEFASNLEAISTRITTLERVAARVSLLEKAIQALERSGPAPAGSATASLPEKEMQKVKEMVGRLADLEKSIQEAAKGSSTKGKGGESPSDIAGLAGIKEKLTSIEKNFHQILTTLESHTRAQEAQKTKLNATVDKLIALEGELKAQKETRKS